MGNVNNRLGEARKQAGLSQGALAKQAGVTRQAYMTIEAGRSAPSIEVALRLARALKGNVESLFSLGDGSVVHAEAVGDVPLAEGARVQMMRVGERLLARAVSGHASTSHVLAQSDGSVLAVDDGGVTVRMPETMPERMPTVVMAGCDPAVSYVAQALQERGVRLLWTESGSMDALNALARGEVHVAGCHVQDPDSHTFNTPLVSRLVPFSCTVVRFAVWRQGLITLPKNPLGLQSVEDMAASGVRIINRQPGSGSRLLLDRMLAASGTKPRYVTGYDSVAFGHLAVAEAVASGLADTGIGAEVAARVMGLDFVPLDEESYDLVIPNRFLDEPGVSRLLEVLRWPRLRAQIEGLGGYDGALMGQPA